MSVESVFPLAEVEYVHEWDRGLKTVRLDLVPEPFIAGQFFQLGLAREGKHIKRSYSAASAPGARLEFYLSLVKGGELTPSLFDLNVGDKVGVDPKALGFFTLREVPDTPTLWLVATGTGLGPYVSMLRQPGELDRFQRVVFVHGARTSAELGYRQEFERAVLNEPRFRYVPVVSRSEPPAGGLGGRITTNFASGALEAAAEAEINRDSHVLFCGNPDMIEEMVAGLKARGLQKHKRREPGHFNFEKYW